MEGWWWGGCLAQEGVKEGDWEGPLANGARCTRGRCSLRSGAGWAVQVSALCSHATWVTSPGAQTAVTRPVTQLPCLRGTMACCFCSPAASMQGVPRRPLLWPLVCGRVRTLPCALILLLLRSWSERIPGGQGLGVGDLGDGTPGGVSRVG